MPGPGVDASGMNLEGAFFGGFNLDGANFARANLRAARFEQIRFYKGDLAFITPVSFQGADLRDSVWADYNRFGLQRADFTEARVENMSVARDPNPPTNFLTPDQIRSTMSYKIKNLSGFDMVGGQLSGREMPDSLEGWTKVSDDRVIRQIALDFSGFDLRQTYFGSGDFTRCDFTDAYVQDAAFSGVKLTYEQIASTLSWHGRVLDVSTIGTPLRLTFRGMDCFGWDFSRRNLRGSRFESVDLTEAIFREADLRDVVFQVSKFEGADLSGSDLRGASIAPARTSNPDCIRNCDIRGASLGMVTREQLESTTSYRMGDLSGTTFHISLAGVDLSRQVLAGCVFFGCDITGTDFTDAVITGCEFRVFKPEDVPSVEQIKSTWNYKHNRMDGIILPQEVLEALKNE
jgi:uncharacterized protein YjbI with pentapeptide repeats